MMCKVNNLYSTDTKDYKSILPSNRGELNKSGTYVNNKFLNYAVCLVKFSFYDKKTS